MQVHIGTSGYNYTEWRGKFYPEGFKPAAMLPYYAERFTTVEINATFYRMPTRKVVEGWAAQVPEAFSFSLKAPRRITHDLRLKDCADPVRAFCEAATALGPRLAVLLVQLPPNLKRDAVRLAACLEAIPPELRVAFEFRHESWWDEETFALLRARNAALCIADSEDRHTPFVPTATFGYLRLREQGYTDEDLARWAARVTGEPAWTDAFVYFKHEDEARGPEFAVRFRAQTSHGSSR